ncbi:MAG: transporter [Gemmatimonadetes bacterium]|nr:transporter [Gemmatimonadota bacterium]MCY3610549.1 transporter [Gemmatimonadota bacterium]
MSSLVYIRLRRGCALLVLAGLWPLAAPDTADAQSLVADRPDFTEATSTVGLGGFQLELGYTLGLDTDGRNTTRVHSYGEPLLRVGVFVERLELRVGTTAVTQVAEASPAGVVTSGLEDLYLGAKIALSGQRGVLPATAILPQMTVATGTGGFSAGRTLPGLNFLYSWDLNESLSLAGSTQVNAAVGDMDENYSEWAQSLSWGIATGQRSGVYAEWYAFVPAGLKGGSAEHYLNSGLTWLANDDLQWDFRFGMGLNAAAEDMYVGAGVVMRVR